MLYKMTWFCRKCPVICIITVKTIIDVFIIQVTAVSTADPYEPLHRQDTGKPFCLIYKSIVTTSCRITGVTL